MLVPVWIRKRNMQRTLLKPEPKLTLSVPASFMQDGRAVAAACAQGGQRRVVTLTGSGAPLSPLIPAI